MNENNLYFAISDFARARWADTVPRVVDAVYDAGVSLQNDGYAWITPELAAKIAENPQAVFPIHILITQPPRQYILFP